MAGKSIAVDPGSYTITVLGLKDGKHGLEMTSFGAVPAKQGAQGLASLGLPLGGSVAGVAGRDMTLRYTQVPPAPDWQLRNLMELEIADLSSQSGDELSADYNLLPPTDEEADSDTILMALARNEALESVTELIGSAGGSIAAHVPNCIAIYNAYLRTHPTDEDQVVCIANIGHETIDIALAKGQDLLFARNLSGGGKVLDDAIASAFNVSSRKAATLKVELLDLDPASRGKFASGQAEKVTMAAGGASTMLVSAIQSSLAFCKQQTGQADLNLDLVLLCGGSARLRGIRGLLREALRCPVDLFDPFVSVDCSALGSDELAEFEAHRSEAVVALGLAAGAIDSSLYSLEILPESVKRRQRFFQRTIFNIAAGLVLAAVLGFMAFTANNEMDGAVKGKSRSRALLSRVEGTHRQTQKILKENTLTQELVEILVNKSLPLDGTIRVMRALQEIPEDLWIQTIEVSDQKGSRVGKSRTKIVHVKGKGKEVTGPAIESIFTKFAASLKSRKDLGEVKTPSTPGEHATIEFDFQFNLLAEPGSAAKGTKDSGEGK
jgi:type IV pilus assembly protein PilM